MSAARSDLALVDSLRERIAAGGGTLLGSGYQATVELFETPRGNVVVKRAHSGVLGCAARAALARERRVYERLDGIPGIPRALGALDHNTLILEYIPGPSLREHNTRLGDRTAFFDAFLMILEAMHAAGVAHGDLKRKDNLLVGPDERPYIVDFGVASVEPGSRALWSNAMYRWMRQYDYNAWVKLKTRRQLEPLTDEDAALYRPTMLERIARVIRVIWQKLTLRRVRRRIWPRR